jgi:hypothetical protein
LVDSKSVNQILLKGDEKFAGGGPELKVTIQIFLENIDRPDGICYAVARNKPGP